LSHIDQKTAKNRILAVLPVREFALTARHLTPFSMDLGQTLHRAGDEIDVVYFVVADLHPP
jgi:hypothetical protein